IHDVMTAIDAACQGHDSHVALNVGSGFGTTLLEMIHLLEESLGKKAELVYKPAVAGELPLAIPDITQTMEKLKWEPQVSIEQGIKRLAEWFKSSDCTLLRT